MLKVKKCKCGYYAASNSEDTTAICICGETITYDEHTVDMEEEVFEQICGETNIVLEKEDLISRYLIDAFDVFVTLEPTHPDDILDFTKALHDIQKVIAMRELRRLLPNRYLTIKNEEND